MTQNAETAKNAERKKKERERRRRRNGDAAQADPGHARPRPLHDPGRRATQAVA